MYFCKTRDFKIKDDRLSYSEWCYNSKIYLGKVVLGSFVCYNIIESVYGFVKEDIKSVLNTRFTVVQSAHINSRGNYDYW